MVLEEPEKLLHFSDEALKNLKAHNLPDWTRFYERSPKFMTNFISTMLEVPEDKQPTFPSRDIEWIEELPYHFMNVDWGSQELEERGTKFLEQFKTEFLIHIRVQAHQFLSLLQYGKPMGQLIGEAKEGNNKSLFRAIQIDKSLLGKRFVSQRVREAELTNDIEFFERLGRAVQKRPMLKSRKQAKLSIILLLLWPMGLSKTTVEETFQFLEEVFDIATLQIDDVETLRKLLNRIGLHKYKKTNRT